MSGKDDGGMAFPGERVETVTAVDGKSTHRAFVQQPGMSLRDYFAGQAISALALDAVNGEVSFDQLAGYAYEIADFMLVERNAEVSE